MIFEFVLQYGNTWQHQLRRLHILPLEYHVFPYWEYYNRHWVLKLQENIEYPEHIFPCMNDPRLVLHVG